MLNIWIRCLFVRCLARLDYFLGPYRISYEPLISMNEILKQAEDFVRERTREWNVDIRRTLAWETIQLIKRLQKEGVDKPL